MKKCKQCEIEKDESNFYKEGNGLRAICKECKNSNTIKWRSENKEKYNSSQRGYNKKNYHKLRLQRYDLTTEEHKSMLESQKHVCAICSKPPGKTRPLVVDHDHNTGKTRALLCYGCNRGLAMIENQEIHGKAITYLKKFGSI